MVLDQSRSDLLIDGEISNYLLISKVRSQLLAAVATPSPSRRDPGHPDMVAVRAHAEGTREEGKLLRSRGESGSACLPISPQGVESLRPLLESSWPVGEWGCCASAIPERPACF